MSMRTSEQRRSKPMSVAKATVVLAAIGIAGSVFASTRADAATVTVTSLSGDAAVVGSLPYVVANDVVAGDTIDFSVTGTITLDDQLLLDEDVTINGPGTQGIVITRFIGSMVQVQAGADVTFDNLEFLDSAESAVRVSSGGNVSVTNSLFTDNFVGVEANTATGITIADSTFSGNLGRAIDLEDIAGPVVIGGTTGTTVDNGGAVGQVGLGIFVDNAASVAITNTDVDDQNDVGIEVVGDLDDTTFETVSIVDSTVTGNDGGIGVRNTDGNVTITGTDAIDTASGSGGGLGIGIWLNDVATVTIDTVSATGSSNSGIRTSSTGPVTATDVTVTGNNGGASYDTATGNVTVTGGSYSMNAFAGLSADGVTGTTSLIGVAVSNNTGNGFAAFNSGNLTVSGATIINGNDTRGLDLQSVGNVDISGATVTANGAGIYINNAGTVEIAGSTIDDQVASTGSATGIGVRISGTVGNTTISSTNVRDNSNSGVLVARLATAPSTSTTGVTASTITGNGGTGLQFTDFAAAGNDASGSWSVSSGTTIATNAIGISANSLGGLLTVDDVTFTTNPVGINMDDSAGLTVTTSTFAGHTGFAMDLDNPGAVTLTNVDVDNDGGVGQTGTGIDVALAASVTVDDLVVSDQAGTGLAVAGDSDDLTAEVVSVINSSFDSNSSGLSIASTDGPVTVSDTPTTNSTGGSGLGISDSTATTLTDLVSTGNASNGFSIDGASTLDANGLTGSSNGTGIFISSVTGSAAVTSSDFANNTGRGMQVNSSDGMVTLQTVTATGNSSNGIAVFTAAGVTIDGVTTTGNSVGVNLNTPGAVDITSLVASTNVGGGLAVSAATSVSVLTSTFDGNTAGTGSLDGAGVSIDGTVGAVSIAQSNMRNNAGEGIELNQSNSSAITTSVDIEDAIITGNAKQGIKARFLAGLMTIDTATLANQTQGIFVENSAGVTAVDVDLDDHSAVAVEITNSGDLDLELAVDQSTDDGLGIRLVNNDAVTIRDTTVEGQVSDILLIDGDAGAITPPAVQILGGSFAASTSAGPEIRDVGDVTITGPTNMSGNDGVGLTMSQVGDVQMTDLTVDASDGVGIDISNAGSVTGTDLSVDTNGGAGLSVVTAGSVSVTRGSFDGNGTSVAGDGVRATNLTGGIVLTDVSANGNSADGIELSATVPASTDLSGAVTFTNVGASNNVGFGLRATTTAAAADAGPITLLSVPSTVPSTFDGNGSTGVSISSAGPVSVSDLTANGNQAGVSLTSVGGATVDELVAGASTGTGVNGRGLSVVNSGGDVDVSAASLGGNGGTGLSITSTGASPASNVTVDAVTADGNAEQGMRVSATGLVTVRNGSSGSNNTAAGSFNGSGLDISGAGGVLISDSTFDGNADDGAEIVANISGIAAVAVTVTNSSFDDNPTDGLEIGGFGSGTTITGSVSITGGTLHRNGTDAAFDAGLIVETLDSVTVSGTSIVDNTIGIKTRELGEFDVVDLALTTNGQAIVANGGGDVAIARVIIDNGTSVAAGVNLVDLSSVEIDDVQVSGAAGSGFSIAAITGTVLIDDSEASNLAGAGVSLNNIGGAAVIRDSTFDDNGSNGISAITMGALTIADTSTDRSEGTAVSASGLASLSITNLSATDSATGSGLNVNGVTGTSTVTGGNFDRNPAGGMVITGADGQVTVTGVNVENNDNLGIRISSDDAVTIGAGSRSVGNTGFADGISISSGGLVTITGVTASGNNRHGVDVSAATAVTMSGSTVDGNGSTSFRDGVSISDVAGAIRVTTTTVANSVGHGLEILDSTGSVTLDGSDFIDNGDVGAVIGRSSSGTPAPVASVSATGASFDRNFSRGATIESAGDVSLTNSSATGNKQIASSVDGALIEGEGIVVLQAADVTLSEVTVTSNESSGLLALGSVVTGDFTIVGGSFSNNADNGIFLVGAADVDIADAAISGNGSRGASVNSIGAITVDGATFDKNADGGLSVSGSTGAGLITDSTFIDDGAPDADLSLTVGGIAAPMTISNLTFTNHDRAITINSATAKVTIEDIDVDGGEWLVSGSDLVDIDLVDITATGTGTGVALSAVTGDIAIESSRFERNTQVSVELSNITGDIDIVNTAITNSRRSLDLDDVDGAVLIDRSSIHGAGGPGAVVEIPFGVIVFNAVTDGVEFVNSSVFDIENGYPIDAVSTELTLRHSTIADNAFDSMIRTDSNIEFDHSVAVGRIDPDSATSSRSVELVTPTGGTAPTVSAEYSMLTPGTVSGGTNLSQIDAVLQPAALNGGTTLSLAPFSTSFLVDAGNPNISGAPSTDQTGAQRIRGVIDIGAVEFSPDIAEPPPPAPPAAVFEPLSPTRFVDTRSNGVTVDGQFEGDGTRGANEEYRVQIAGRGDVPADAKGVVMNITAVRAQSRGFVTVHPCANPRPLASSLNFTAGVNLGNEIIAGLSDSGELCIFTNQATEITVDVTGYVATNAATESITPVRMMDTRPGQTTFDEIGDPGEKLEAGSNTILLLNSRGDVPSDARSVILNITAVGAERNGFVTVHPCVDEVPLASSLNYVAGVNRGNELVAAVDPGGRICIFTSQEVHITVDVVGYVPFDLSYSAVEPARLLDTRPGQLTADGRSEGTGIVSAGGSVTLDVAGRAGVPANARAVVVNVTAIRPSANGFVTVHPCLDEPPLASSLNYVPGVNGANEIVVLLDDDGQMCLFTRSQVHLAVDVIGYLVVR